jgi:hypothetical protein
MFRVTPAVRAAAKAERLKKRYRPGGVNWRRAIALRNRLIDAMDDSEYRALQNLGQK